VTPFSDIARAAYCPRQLYYARREDDRAVPGEVRARIDLAFRYPTLVDAPDATLRRLPIRRSPAAYRRNLAAAARATTTTGSLIPNTSACSVPERTVTGRSTRCSRMERILIPGSHRRLTGRTA